jgi:hypothetical protein
LDAATIDASADRTSTPLAFWHARAWSNYWHQAVSNDTAQSHHRNAAKPKKWECRYATRSAVVQARPEHRGA